MDAATESPTKVTRVVSAAAGAGARVAAAASTAMQRRRAGIAPGYPAALRRSTLKPLPAPEEAAMVLLVDTFDAALLDRLQNDLPLVERPWAALAEALDTSESRVLERVRALRLQGI